MAYVLTIENAWLCYRNRRTFKLLKHAIRAAVSDTESLMFENVYITCGVQHIAPFEIIIP